MSSSDSVHYDVFLSHHNRDKPIVERIALKLKESGIEPWFDKWCLTLGGDWQNELAVGLRLAHACAVFLGGHGLGNWENLEYKLATDRMSRDSSFRVFLVLLPGLSEPFDTSTLPPFLCTRTWVDLRRGFEETGSIQRLISAIRGLPLGAEGVGKNPHRGCPYKGLQAFAAEDSDIFFGRDGDIQRLLEKLKGARFLGLIGSSGSGKSSLVKAGLLPALAKDALPQSSEWLTRLLLPGSQPLTSLAAHLLHLQPDSAMQLTIDHLMDDVRTVHFATSLTLATTSSKKIVWIVDQFEELFTLCKDSRERTQFIDNLLYAASVPNGHNLVVIVMRADFYSRCTTHPALSAVLAANNFLVGSMTSDSLRQTIEGPARIHGLEIERGLITVILNDVVGRPGVLPLLQYALLETWKRREENTLTLTAYQESGGLEKSLSQAADAIFLDFLPKEQQLARQLFLRLVELGDGGIDMRRRCQVSEVIIRVEDKDAIERVMQTMTEARLLTTGGSTGVGEQWIEISHEALINGWSRLRDWVSEERLALRVHRHLTEAANEWNQLSRDSGVLYRGARLLEAREWMDVHGDSANPLERSFLRASLGVETRDRWRNRLLVAALLLAFVTATILAIRAVIQRNEAHSKELALRARSLIGTDPVLAALLAMAAWHESPTFESEMTLRECEAETHLIEIIDGTTFVEKPMTAAEAREEAKRIVAGGEYRVLRVYRGGASAHGGRETKGVNSVSFSSDGSYFVTGATDNVARVWDTKTRKVVAELKGHTQDVWDAAFSPNDNLVVTASDDRTARVWEWRSGKVRLELKGHRDVLGAARFSGDGKTIITASYDGTARIWNAENGQMLKEFPISSGPVLSAQFSPDSKYVVTTNNNRASLWDIASSRLTMELKGPSGAIATARFSKDGRYLVTAAEDGVAQIWNLQTQKIITTLRGHIDRLRDAEFSPDGRFVVTASDDSTGRLWNVNTGSSLLTFDTNGGTMFAATFSPDGRTIATASADHKIRLWDADTKRISAQIGGHVGGASKVLFSPNGTFVLIRWDSKARIWNAITHETVEIENDSVSTDGSFSPDSQFIVTAIGDKVAISATTSGRNVRLLDSGAPQPIFASFSPDGKIVIAVSKNGRVQAWDTAQWGSPRTWTIGSNNITAVALSPDGSRLATADKDGTAYLTQVSSGLLEHRLPGQSEEIRVVAFSPNGKILATGSLDGTVRLWATETGDLLRNVDSKSGWIRAADFSPDGTLLAVASNDNAARIWETNSGRLKYKLDLHSGIVNVIKFSPDGKIVVTGGLDGRALAWNSTNGELITGLYGHRGGLEDIAFSLDQLQLITACTDGTVRIFPREYFLPIEEVFVQAKSRVNRDLSPEEKEKYLK